MNNKNTKLTTQETEFVIDGLVLLIAQAERELLKCGIKSKIFQNENICNLICDYQERKIETLEKLKAKF